MRNPDKYTLDFGAGTWAALNSMWVEELKETVKKLCVLRKVERPAVAVLQETGLPPYPAGQSTARPQLSTWIPPRVLPETCTLIA